MVNCARCKSISAGASAFAALSMYLFSSLGALAQEGTNSCPVDGCEVEIVDVSKEDGEVRLDFAGNFTPSLSKNHLHVWWGENWDVRQVSANAESTYDVTQGVWHPTDDFPSYLTTGVISVAERGGAETLCVTAADRNHDILDTELVDCRSVADLLK